MKRGNTALKRVVSVASVAAMAIAGAVLAAPAASAAPGAAAALRATPSADAAYVQTDGTAGDYNGSAAYAVGVPTGVAHILKAGVNGQKANNLQVAIPAGYTGGDVLVNLPAGVSWASYSVSLSRTPVTAASLDAAAGFVDAANHASLGTGAPGTLLQAGAVGAITTPTPNQLRITLAGDATGNAVGVYVLSIDNVALSVASTFAGGEIVADLTGTTVGAGLDGATSIGYVPDLYISAGAGVVEADGAAATNTVTLPAITVSEKAANDFAGSVELTVTGGDVDKASTITANVSGAGYTGATVPAIAADGDPVVVNVSGTATAPGTLTVSGIKVKNVAKNANVTVTVTTPGTAIATTTADVFNFSPALSDVAVTVKTTLPEPRIAGSDRYATAADIADKIVALGAPAWSGNAVVIANGETAKDGADALAANYLAAAKGAPILLTSATSLPDATQAALIKLFKGYNSGNITVYVMGKDDSVSAAVRDRIKFIIGTTAALSGTQEVKIVEVAGDNRYQTSAASATEGGAANLQLHSLTTSGGWLRTAFLASGTTNADALAAGSVSVKAGIPVFLTNGMALDQKVQDAIKALGIQQVIVLGATDRVSADLVDSLKDLGVTSTKRIAESDRYETAAAIASWAYAPVNPTGTETNRGLGWTGSTAYIANGREGFPDALSVGPLAGAQNDAILTTAVDSLTKGAVDFLKAQKATLTGGVWVLGQQDRVSSAVITAAQDALK